MEEHWAAGYNDAVRTLRHPEVLQRPDTPDGVATFDLPIRYHHNETASTTMKIAEVRDKAFAMPLNDPAYPRPPYKFYNREFVVINYRTDPRGPARRRARAAGGGRRHRRLRVHPHAGFDRVSATTPKPGRSFRCASPRHRARCRRAATCMPCISTTIRRSPAGARSGAFRRSWRRRS